MAPSYHRSDDVLFEDFGDSIIVSATESSWFTLSGSAATIWRVLANPTTVDELVSRCLELYSGPADVIGADVAATLEDWATRGLIASD